MTVVVGIRFKDSGKVYYFDPRDLELSQGEFVIVETVRGLELAKVAYERREVEESEIVGELKPVVRRAESSDFERMRVLHERHDEALRRCAEKVQEHNLPMSMVKAEYSFDGSRLTFYFTAEKRVDFRLLVRDLARTFRSRIELRQIGPRDEAKLLGGIGPCGRLLCCATFLPDYARVSIKMAKDQDLPLNPAKISGVCGRLLCCLSYEHEQYIEMRAELPRKGTWVQTPDGPGEVVAVNVLRQSLTVQLASSGMQEEYARSLIEISTATVAETARSRNKEGITPAAARREPREQRDRGQRRLLRDEIEQNDILGALGLIDDPDEEGLEALEAGDLYDEPPARSAQPPRKRRPEQAEARTKPSQNDKTPHPDKNRPHQQPQPPAPAGEEADSAQARMRRRRRPRGKAE